MADIFNTVFAKKTKLTTLCIIKIFRGEGVVDGEGVAVKGS